MNFLAHVYLSNDEKLITVGNFIGDFVKGKQFEAFPDKIREGILLHRAIDSYTDSHLLTSEARSWMYPQFGKYSGIYLDIFYDHFLAANWIDYHDMALKKYSNRFYMWLVQNYFYLPLRVQGFLPNIIVLNRLYTYRKVEGIQRALFTMSQHTSLPTQSVEATQFLIDHYSDLEQNFRAFFNDLKDYVATKPQNTLSR